MSIHNVAYGNPNTSLWSLSLALSLTHTHTHTQTRVTESCPPSHRAVFPVADNLLQVGGWVKQEMLPPFIPVHSHGAVCIDTVRQEQTEDIDDFISLQSEQKVPFRYK